MYRYIYTLFLIFFFIKVYHRILNWFPGLWSRTLLLIQSVYNSLYLLIPNSQSPHSAPPNPLGKHKPVLYVCEPVESQA